MTAKPSWQRVAELFEQALEQPQAERVAWVADACGGDAALLREVEKLLTAHDRATGCWSSRSRGFQRPRPAS